MRLRQILFLIFVQCCFGKPVYPQSTGSNPLSIDGFSLWRTGCDSATTQLIPGKGNNGLMMEGGKTVAHARFKVHSYGELSIPISSASAPNAEAHAVNLSNSRYVRIRYKANQTIILQLRQTGIHGGIHNHVLLPPSREFTNTTIYFSTFKGGSLPLDLKDVAKFNFAFLYNNEKDGYADMVIQSFVIDRYKP